MLIVCSTKHITVYRYQNGTDLKMSDGEAGYGLYAFLQSASLHKYYAQGMDTRVTLTIDYGKTLDCTAPSIMKELLLFCKQQAKDNCKEYEHYIPPKITRDTLERYGYMIIQFIQKFYPQYCAYIVPHKGPGLPTGKQLVIRDLSCISKSVFTPLKEQFHE